MLVDGALKCEKKENVRFPFFFFFCVRFVFPTIPLRLENGFDDEREEEEEKEDDEDEAEEEEEEDSSLPSTRC